MAKQRIHRKIEQDTAEKARIQAVRDSFQKERPTLDELVRKEDFEGPSTLGEFLEAKAIAHMLRTARIKAKMSLSEVSAVTGMDRGTISRLENGVYPNTTINTINRLANAYGKQFTFRLEDSPAEGVNT